MKRLRNTTQLTIWTTLVVLSLFSGLLVMPQAARAGNVGPMDVTKMDAFMAEAQATYHIPGMAAVVVENGQVLLSKGYGLAAPGQPATPQTQFYLGSVSKSITALAVMQLVEQGRLELDAPVQRYLPWFAVADPEASKTITVRHLLNHTSGLSAAADPRGSLYQPTLEKQVRAMTSARLTAPVGTKYQYDNQNYRVLGLLVETISGQNLGDYLHQHVFLPLGMTHSAANPAAAPELAQGYSQAFGFPLARQQEFRPGGLPSGYLISSAEDMGKYIIAVLDEMQANGQPLVKKETFAQMMAPPAGIDSEYGMGWVISKSTDGVKVVYHGGNIEYFNTMVFMLPEEKRGFVLLINQGNMLQIFTGREVLVDGMVKLLGGEEAPAIKSYNWLYAILALVAALLVGLQIFGILRLPAWKKALPVKPPLRRWLSVGVDILLPSFFLFGFPHLMNALMGDSATWLEAFNFMPDAIGALLAACFLALGRGLAKLWWVWQEKHSA